MRALIAEKHTKKAETETMKEVGADPTDGSVLEFYPNPEAKNYIIPHNKKNIALNVADIHIKILKSKISSQFNRRQHTHRYFKIGDHHP